MFRNPVTRLSFFAVTCALLFLAACSNAPKQESAAEPTVVKADSNARQAKNFLTDCNKLYAEARHSDSILLQQNEINVPSAKAAIKAFTDFAYYCHGDSISPVYLVKTAQVARAINNIPQAKTALDKCIEDYPSFSNRAAALFLLAQLYDEPGYLNNEEEARKLYQKIIDEHPKSDWAVSAKGAIGFLGKSDQQIMEEFKKKYKK